MRDAPCNFRFCNFTNIGRRFEIRDKSPIRNRTSSGYLIFFSRITHGERALLCVSEVAPVSFFTIFCSRLIFSDKGVISQMEGDTGVTPPRESINDGKNSSLLARYKRHSRRRAPCEASALMQLCPSIALRRTAPAVNNKQRRSRESMCRAGITTRFSSRGRKRKIYAGQRRAAVVDTRAEEFNRMHSGYEFCARDPAM